MSRISRSQKKRITARKKRIRARQKLVDQVKIGKIPDLTPSVKVRKRKPIRTSPPRSSVNLGQMGELGPDTILKIELNKSAAGFFGSGKAPKALHVNKLRKLLKREIIEPMDTFINERIEAFAPVDTIDLQTAMKNSKGHPFSVPVDKLTSNQPTEIRLGTPGVNYAAVVNRMPTAWLKHPEPYHKNVSERGGVFHDLYDPKAKKGFYDEILTNGRRKASHLVINFVRGPLTDIFRKWPALFPIPQAPAKQVFKFYAPHLIRT